MWENKLHRGVYFRYNDSIHEQMLHSALIITCIHIVALFHDGFVATDEPSMAASIVRAAGIIITYTCGLHKVRIHIWFVPTWRPLYYSKLQNGSFYCTQVTSAQPQNITGTYFSCLKIKDQFILSKKMEIVIQSYMKSRTMSYSIVYGIQW